MPYNFDVFQCRRPKFSNMIYFDVFSSKMSLVSKFKASMTSSKFRFKILHLSKVIEENI